MEEVDAGGPEVKESVWDCDRTWLGSRLNGPIRNPCARNLGMTLMKERSDGQLFYARKLFDEAYPVESVLEELEIYIESFRTCSCRSWNPRPFCLWHNCEHKESAD